MWLGSFQPIGVTTHMEIFGCNNLVSYKVENTIDLQRFLPCYNLVPWICNVFYLVTTLFIGSKHLITTLMYLCKDYMVSTLQKLVIPILGIAICQSHC